MIPLYFLLGLTLIGVLCTVFLVWRSDTSTGNQENQTIGEFKNALAKMTSERDEQAGKSKQLFAELTNAKADTKAISAERDLLQKRVNQFEEEKLRREKEQEVSIHRLATAEKNFEAEKARVIHEEESRRQQEVAERDRMWNEHENKVVSELTDLCNQPQTSFTSFDNQNLPEGFHGSLKPDFMIEFLEQYVIFDVKVSEAKNLQTYINDQVKKTAQKVKGNDKIYSSVFLVVPTIAIKDLRKKSFYEEGFNFFVVSPESIAPLLALFKKIESYEFAEAMDPKERESIVDLIAAFHFHISTRNAHELGMMLHGLETLSKAEQAHPDLVTEALVKKAKMRNINVNTAETKQLVSNPEEVAKQLLELVNPKAKITNDDL